jgi:hypothetical protein
MKAGGQHLSGGPIMWRAFFLAIGTYLVLLGAQCLGVEQFVLKSRDNDRTAQTVILDPDGSQAKAGRVIDPPPWAPWSLMATGAVVCLYSFSIPRRMNSG